MELFEVANKVTRVIHSNSLSDMFDPHPSGLQQFFGARHSKLFPIARWGLTCVQLE